MEQEHVTLIEHATSLGSWVITGWYMLGAACRGAFKYLGWVKDPHGHSRKYELAEIGQALLLSFAMAFVLVQGLLWAWADYFGLALPEFKVTALSAIGVGFFLERLVGERVISWLAKRKKQ